jgi:hypothetical protein
LLLAAFLALASGCGGQDAAPKPPAVLIASDRLMQLEIATGRIVKQRILPAPATDLDFNPAAGRIAVATLRGPAVMDADRFDVLWSGKPEIIDAIELGPDGERAYVLVHPGRDPHESEGDHLLLEIALPGGNEIRRATLDARAYDLLLDPPSGGLYVTDLVGRAIHRVDLTTFAISNHQIGTGADPRVEPRGAFLRLLLPGRRPGELFPVEDRRDLARLWRWEPRSGALAGQVLDGVAPPVLGGGPDGDALWLHTRREFLRLDAQLAITTRVDLPEAAADSAGGYRFAATDGRVVVLLGPAAPERGMMRARVTWLDLATGAPAGQRLLEVRAGPLAILPPAAAAESATRSGQ